MKDKALKFNKYTFKRNKAFRHGWALSIQTLNKVEIVDCIFESNEAFADFESSGNLLFENHYHKKDEGRGGAIYINPTFTYSIEELSCSSIDSYMISFSI